MIKEIVYEFDLLHLLLAIVLCFLISYVFFTHGPYGENKISHPTAKWYSDLKSKHNDCLLQIEEWKDLDGYRRRNGWFT